MLVSLPSFLLSVCPCLLSPCPDSHLHIALFQFPLSSSHSAADCGKARKSSSSHSANTLGTPSYPAAPINSDVCPVASGMALATWITYKYTHTKKKSQAAYEDGQMHTLWRDSVCICCYPARKKSSTICTADNMSFLHLKYLCMTLSVGKSKHKAFECVGHALNAVQLHRSYRYMTSSYQSHCGRDGMWWNHPSVCGQVPLYVISQLVMACDFSSAIRARAGLGALVRK